MQEKTNEHHIPHLHIGMRKVKSVLAIVVGFFLWQILRLLLPELETHPLFVYIYGLIEIRETSQKTTDYGRMRVFATFTAIVIGLPFMLLNDWSETIVVNGHIWIEIALLVLGALLVLCVAEWVKCGVYCGLAAAIYIILMLSHFESGVYLHSVMRAFQTIIGVFVAWLINVKLLPYPPKPGSLSYWFSQKAKRFK